MPTQTEELLDKIVNEIAILRDLYVKARDKPPLSPDERLEVIRGFSEIGNMAKSLPEKFRYNYANSANWSDISEWRDPLVSFPNGYNPIKFTENWLLLEYAKLEIDRHLYLSHEIQNTTLENARFVESVYLTMISNIGQGLRSYLWLTGFLAALRFGMHETELLTLSKWEFIPSALIFIPVIMAVLGIAKEPDILLAYPRNAENFATHTEFYDYSRDRHQKNMNHLASEQTKMMNSRYLTILLFWIFLFVYTICLVIFIFIL